MANSTVYELPRTVAFQAPNHRDLMHEELHQRLGGAGFYSPPPPLGSGSDDRAQLLTWFASLPANSTVGLEPGYLVSSRIPFPDGHRYVGRGVAEGSAPHIKLMNGVNPAAAIDGVVVSKAWDDNNTFGGVPTIYENLQIDGNAANNTGTYSCLIPFSYWSRTRWCRFDSPRLHHVYLSKFMKNGVEATPDMADNRIYGCRFRIGLTGTDGAAVRSVQPSGGNHNQDIRFFDNHIESGQNGLWADHAAGWTIFDNHFWCNRDAIRIDNGFYASKVIANYVDGFGQGMEVRTHYGIRVRGFDGPGCIVAMNHVDINEAITAGTHYFYELNGQNANSHIVGGMNTAYVGTANANTRGFVYGANNGAILFDMVANRPVNFPAGQDFVKVESGGGIVTILNPRPISGSATWNPGSVAAAAVSTQTITVTGAEAGDPVHVGFTPALAAPLSWRVWAMVTGTNTVTVFFENRSGSPITPASTTVRAAVLKY